MSKTKEISSVRKDKIRKNKNLFIKRARFRLKQKELNSKIDMEATLVE